VNYRRCITQPPVSIVLFFYKYVSSLQSVFCIRCLQRKKGYANSYVWTIYNVKTNSTALYMAATSAETKIALLLFISYTFVKGFLVITYLLLVISSWNFHNVCQRFLYHQEQNFSLIRQKTNIFPIDPHYKNHPLL